MRFLGGKWQKKNKRYGNGNRMSCFGLYDSLRVIGAWASAGLLGTARAFREERHGLKGPKGCGGVGFLGILPLRLRSGSG